MIERHFSQLPPLNLSLSTTRDRSLFTGPLAKGVFMKSPEILRDLSETNTTAATTRSKATTHRRTSSLNASPFPSPTPSLHVLADVYPSITKVINEKECQTTRLPRDFKLSLKTKLPSGEIFRRHPEAINADIMPYLGYLEDPQNSQTEAFTSKMRKKYESPLKSAPLDDEDEIEEDSDKTPTRNQRTPRWSKSISQRHSPRNSENFDSIVTEKDHPVPKPLRLDIHRHSESLLSSFADVSPAMRTTQESPGIKFKSEFPGTPRSRPYGRVTIKHEVLNEDEIVAKSLAQEIAINYHSYMERSWKRADFRAKIEDLLTGHGVINIFKNKVDQDLTLEQKIFKDMTEYVEVPLTNKQQRASERHMSLIPSARISIMKRVKTKLKIIDERYQGYKKINKKLIDTNTESKVQEVKGLESHLMQMHDDFLKKKHTVLNKMARTNITKYRALKKDCQRVENMIIVRENYNQDEKKLSKETYAELTFNQKVNRGLEEVLNNWRDKLRALKGMKNSSLLS